VKYRFSKTHDFHSDGQNTQSDSRIYTTVSENLPRTFLRSDMHGYCNTWVLQQDVIPASVYVHIYTVSQKKQDTLLMSMTSWNIDRFSKFFHC